MSFPDVRPRRLRQSPAMRRLVTETRPAPAELVLPLFVREGLSEPRPVSSLPGVLQHSRDSLRKAAVDAVQAGIGGLMLFGVPDERDEVGTGATDPDGILNVAIRDVVSEVGDATVFVDDGLIVRVLTNLLANAVKHTPSGGKVRVEARKADEGTDFVLIRVSDTGPGITSEDAPNVFDRFYQGGSGRSRGGTGLGLAFCRLAVALHGGTIHVANPGQPGATIDLTLPAAAADHVAVLA